MEIRFPKSEFAANTDTDMAQSPGSRIAIHEWISPIPSEATAVRFQVLKLKTQRRIEGWQLEWLWWSRTPSLCHNGNRVALYGLCEGMKNCTRERSRSRSLCGSGAGAISARLTAGSSSWFTKAKTNMMHTALASLHSEKSVVYNYLALSGVFPTSRAKVGWTTKKKKK